MSGGKITVSNVELHLLTLLDDKPSREIFVNVLYASNGKESHVPHCKSPTVHFSNSRMSRMSSTCESPFSANPRLRAHSRRKARTD
jgi:hypothetical protein